MSRVRDEKDDPRDEKIPKLSSKFSEPWEDSNVVFTVEDEEFHCHDCVVKLHSPVFRAMFSGNFREGRSSIVPLPGKEKNAFRLFLELMYPLEGGKYPVSSMEVMVKVLEYVEEYNAPSVCQHIDNMLYFQHYLCGNPYAKCSINITNLLRDLKMCDNHKLEMSRMAVMNHILDWDAKNGFGNYLSDVPGFKMLEGESKFQLVAGLIKKYSATKVKLGECYSLIGFNKFAGGK